MLRRQGATLVEVLVAMFVMAIGLLSLLALFPLGAFRMAQAINANRAADCAANATTPANAWNLRHDPLVVAAFDNPGVLPDLQPSHVAASDPGTVTGNHRWADGPSYPVFVDPV